MATKGEPLYERRVAELAAARSPTSSNGADDDNDDDDDANPVPGLEEAQNLGDEWLDNRETELWHAFSNLADDLRHTRRRMYLEDVYDLRRPKARPPRHLQ